MMINNPFYSFLHEDTISIDLKCTICLKPFQVPWTHATCNQIFCFSCISDAKFICPTCQTNDKSEFFLLKIKAIDNLLSLLDIKCQICLKTMKKAEFENHQLVCLSKCSFCEVFFPLKVLKDHIKECQEEIVLFSSSNNNKNVLKRKFHEIYNIDECEPKEMICPYGCNKKINKNNHDEICSERIVECEAQSFGCLEKVKRKDLKEHLNKCDFIGILKFYDEIKEITHEYFSNILKLDMNPPTEETQKRIYPYISAFVNKMNKSLKQNKKLVLKKMKNYYDSLNLGKAQEKALKTIET